MILVQEKEYLEKRERERIQNLKEIESKSQEYDNPNLDLDSQRRIFFQSQSKHNPEYRKESSRFREYLEEMDEKAHCSKIGKKVQFQKGKKHYLHFQKWQKKINFCTRKKFKIAFLFVLNFLLV